MIKSSMCTCLSFEKQFSFHAGKKSKGNQALAHGANHRLGLRKGGQVVIPPGNELRGL